MQVGDVVRLKSGGPQMTVVMVENDKATCRWFDSNQNIWPEHQFPFAALEAEKSVDN